MQNLLFSFADLSVKDKAARQAVRYFSRAGAHVVQQDAVIGLTHEHARAGAHVVQQDVNASVKRTAGITCREMALTFADSQQVVLRIKQTGDIFQVLLNGRVLPLRHQDDHVKAIAEVVQAMDAGRARFQKLLAAARVRPPAGIRTAAPKMEQILTEKRDALKAAIADVQAQIAAILATLAA